MKRSRLPKPTEAELSILRVLWERGPSTVRQVWERLFCEDYLIHHEVGEVSFQLARH
jgi:predicted transcriptional regulator